MNKIPAYIAIAILLGTVTMIIPYALLESSDYTSLTDENPLTEPNPQEPSETTDQPTSAPSEPPNRSESSPTHEPAYTIEAESTTENSDSLAPDEPSESEAEPSPEAAGAEPALGGTGFAAQSVSILSSIGLLIVPSFLIALGAFIYLKKRRL